MMECTMYFELNKAVFDLDAPYPSMRPYELGNGLRAANTINASGLLLMFQSLPLSAIHLVGVRLL